jgi:hypothetical protein
VTLVNEWVARRLFFSYSIRSLHEEKEKLVVIKRKYAGIFPSIVSVESTDEFGKKGRKTEGKKV